MLAEAILESQTNPVGIEPFPAAFVRMSFNFVPINVQGCWPRRVLYQSNDAAAMLLDWSQSPSFFVYDRQDTALTGWVSGFTAVVIFSRFLPNCPPPPR